MEMFHNWSKKLSELQLDIMFIAQHQTRDLWLYGDRLLCNFMPFYGRYFLARCFCTRNLHDNFFLKSPILPLKSQMVGP